jgi:hypothetical protein
MKIKIKGKWISIEPKVLTAKEIDSLRIKSYKFKFGNKLKTRL